MTTRVAAKILSRVEVSAEASNQHEFQAGVLRKALDLPESKTSGKLDITYVLDDEADAEGESCSYTMSNVRRKNPKRDEFHMYYSSNQLQQRAREGDILVLSRNSNSTNLRALIVRPATELGSQIKELLDDTGARITSRFRRISARLRDSSAWDLFTAAAESSRVPSAEDFLRFADTSFLKNAIEAGKIPAGKRMADEAGRLVDRMNGERLDADTFMQWRLDAETTLFQHLEKAIGQRELDRLVQSGSIDFGDAAQLVMKHLQSRKSRRGQSLQNHFASLLDRESIKYTAQCKTENGEKPDFMMPGCRQYADRSFPDQRLRMVACKSILRERWDQLLNEAKRIPEKYLLTLDLGITDSTIAYIRRKRVRIFIPGSLSEAAYRHHRNRREIESVAHLVERLRASQA